MSMDQNRPPDGAELGTLGEALAATDGLIAVAPLRLDAPLSSAILSGAIARASGLSILPLLDVNGVVRGVLDRHGLAVVAAACELGEPINERWLLGVALSPPPSFDEATALDHVVEACAMAPPHPLNGWFIVTAASGYRGVGRVASLLPALLTPAERVGTSDPGAGGILARTRRAHADFLIAMSHDMRTPLSGVVGALDLLQTTMMTNEQNDLVAGALASAEVIVNLIGDVVELSRADANAATVAADVIDPAALLQEVIGAWRDQTGERGPVIDHHVEPTVPKLISGDRMRLHRVLLTLLGNAVRANDQGSVFLLLRSKPYDGQAGLEWLVLDARPARQPVDSRGETSPGHADPETRRRLDAGVGRSILRRSVEILGGALGSDGGPEGGGAFWVHMPCVILTPAAARPPASFEGDAILLLADERPDCREAERMLARAGARVLLAPDAGAAGGALSRESRDGQPIRVIIAAEDALPADPADWRWLTATRRPVILLTRDDTPAARRRAHVAGIQYILARPAGRAELLDLISHVIGRAGPVQPSVQPTQPTNAALRSALRRRVGGPPILVIDDTEMNRTVVGRQVAKLGFDADLVADAPTGLDRLAERSYALVLLDLAMPDMDGFEFTKRRRQAEAGTGRRVPIIAITAHALRDYVERGIAAGMDDYLTKPVTLERLAETLRRWLPVVLEPLDGAAEDGDARPGAAPEEHGVAAAIDLSALSEMVGELETGDAVDLLELFLQSVDPTLAELASAIERQDRGGVSRAAHAAANASLNSGAHRLGHWLREIEAAAPFAGWSHIVILGATIIGEHEQVRRFVADLPR